MKQTKYYTIVNVLFAFMMGIVGTSLYVKVQARSNPVKKNKTFIYYGPEDYSIEEVGADFFSKPLEPPLSIAISDKEISLSADAAAKIGICILTAKFGRSFIDAQKPFRVFLLQDKVWKITGGHNSNNHAISEIYIQKSDAKILRIVKNIH